MRQLRRRFPLESWVLLHPPLETIASPATTVEALPAEPPVRHRGHPIIAWIIIVALVTLAAWGQSQRGGPPEPEESAAEPTPSGDRVANALDTLQTRYMVGAHSFLREGGEQFLEQLRPMLSKSIEERLQYAIYAGELDGPTAALEALTEIEKNSKLDADQRKLLLILRKLYTDYLALRFDAPSVSPAEQELVQQKLGWPGELAFAPEGVAVPKDVEAVAGAALAVPLENARPSDESVRNEVLAPARRAFVATVAGVSGVLCTAFLGLLGLSLIGLLALSGKVTSRLTIVRGNGGIYAETFALWLLLFIVLMIVPRLLLPDENPFVLSLITFFGSLVAVFWPVLRGIPWRTVKEEIGWANRAHPLVESLWGLAWYVMSLPLLVVGAALTLFLIFLKGMLENAASGGGGGIPTTSRDAAHPVFGELAGADPLTLLVIFLVASVAAPIVEETFFRGVLHRHLRESTRRWGSFLSIVACALFVSFIFAVIHPQGLLGVPVLMSLAIGFTLAREARGSLIPCMIAHGVSNGLVLLFAVVMLQA